MLNKILKFIKNNTIILVGIIYFSAPYIAGAATLSIAPSASSISTGNIITVKVIVNTVGKYINNIDSVIQFPTDLLEVVSISKSSSIFSLWVEEPTFSNYTGKIKFNGGVSTPGFNGSSGTVASITFKSKKEGTASIVFTDGSIRENDGLGTNIITGKFGSSVTIKNSEIQIPKNIDKPIIVNEKKDNVLKEFGPSIRFEGNQGILKLSDEENIINTDYYIIQIDQNPNFKVSRDELINNEYIIPLQNEGKHILNIITFDKNGKYVESNIKFISPSISIPELSLSKGEVTKGDDIVINGKTIYPNSEVVVIFELDSKEIKRYTQKTGEDGSFSITTDKIKDIGLINIFTKIIISDGVESKFSEKSYLKVNETPVMKITLSILYPLISLIVIVVLAIVFITLLYIGWHKFFGLKKKINKDLENINKDVHKAMLLLKDELNDQLKILEKIREDRALNNKEEAIFDEIKKNIDSVDKFIEKRLKI